MMNIFIMILVAIFMLGYYVIDSPSQRVPKTETEYAVAHADLHAIAQCAAAVHNAKIHGTEFNDICVSQNNITSQLYCLNNTGRETKCEIVRNKKPAYSYIITTTAPLAADDFNEMMNVLEEYYADSGTFGILMDGKITSGGTGTKRTVPKAILSGLKLSDGQLVYMTQYEIPDAATEMAPTDTADIICPTGTVKTYRFGRWQCIGYNTKSNCAGDMVWDSDLSECVPDESRKPLCASQQTAVIVDSVWECIDPFSAKVCPDKLVARLNYNTLEWECIEDPNSVPTKTKCDKFISRDVQGAIGATLRTARTSCTDCEKMIIDEDTCTSYCVPDTAKVNDPACYAGDARECSGPSRAFYFGFPNYSYATNVTAVAKYTIQPGGNRRFNCRDCGDGVIDTTKSLPPYIAICK